MAGPLLNITPPPSQEDRDIVFCVFVALGLFLLFCAIGAMIVTVWRI